MEVEMYDKVNEDVMWQRLVDLQREREYSRLLAARSAPVARGLLRRLAGGLRRLGDVLFEPDSRARIGERVAERSKDAA
jgi:hypothetical protein